MFFRLPPCIVTALVCLLALSPLPAYGQGGRGGLTGLISDPTGALVPGVRIELTNVATGVMQETTSSSAGLYNFSNLIPGTYRLRAAVSGFQSTVRDGIRIEVDRVTEFNAQLRVGDVNESVTVEAEATLANTYNSTIGQLITAKTLESLPMNGRNVFLLVQYTPGVIPVNGALNRTGAENRPGVEVSAFRINGGQPGSVAYLLDGSPLTVDGYGAGATSPAFLPALESVQEFRMQSNNFSPSYLSPGTGVISLVSKSGADRFHGSGFFFARPNALAANDTFVKAAQIRAGQPNSPPDFQRYQWGGTIGGPIRRGKSFFFGGYEGTRTRQLETITVTVPTEAEKRGDYSGIPVIYDPFNISAAGQRLPFAGNIIPAPLMDPVAVNMQKFSPNPNQAGVGRYHQNNYFSGATFPNDSQKYDGPVDHNLTQYHQIFGRYSWAKMVTGKPDHYGNGADPQFYDSLTYSQNAAIGYNWTVNPTTILQFRQSFTRRNEDQIIVETARTFDLEAAGFPASLKQFQTLRTIPRMDIAGTYGLGSRNFSIGFAFVSQNFNSSVSLDKTVGRHGIKVGFDYLKSFVNMGQPISPSGWFQFDTTATSSRTLAADGYGHASYLLGMGTPTSTQNSFTIDPFVAHSSPYYALFIQDNIRVSQRLTLDLGLRWEAFGGRSERYGRQTWFDPNATHTVNGVALRGGLLFPKGTNSPFDLLWKNFGPRFGLAYRLGDSGVFHAGFGMFVGPSKQGVGIAGTNSDSFSSRTTWEAVSTDSFGNTIRLNPLHNPFPNGITLPTQGSLGLATNLGSNLQTVFQREPMPAAYNFNIGLQKEVGLGILLSAAWAGSRGLHLINTVDFNQLTFDQLSTYGASLNDQVPNPFRAAITDRASSLFDRSAIPRWQAISDFPQFATGRPSSGVSIREYGVGNSVYHSLQLKAERRLSRGLSLLGSYTWGKLLSTFAGPYGYIGQNSGFQNWKSLQLDRSVDTQDVSQWFSAVLFYDLPVGRDRAWSPSGRLANAIAGGWSINAGLSMGVGVPVIVSGNWPNRSLFFNQRPNLNCDPGAGAPRTPERWFQPDCFSVPASAFVAGTAPRTLAPVRADGARNLDVGLFKDFTISEYQRVQIRLEAFSLTNTVQYGIPRSAWTPVDNSAFGAVTNANNTPRQFQFGVRYQF